MTTARQTRSTFKLEITVDVAIDAPAEKVWALITDAAKITEWNSAVTKIEGDIAVGNKLSIQVPISDRTFTPKVVAMEENRRMVWGDGFAPMFRGERTYTLTPTDSGCTFTMTEVFSGLMFPMIAGSLPDMGPSFDTWAADLKAAAEA